MTLPRADHATDESTSKDREAQSVDWEIPDPPPLPDAREPKDILRDIQNLTAISNEPEGLKLVREQLYAPRVWLPLAEDYQVSFGGPILVRRPMLEDKFDSREIHGTLMNIEMDAKRKLKERETLPGIVFDIGRLYLSEESRGISAGPEYQPTDYRVILEWTTKAVWLFYEYYRTDADDSVIEFKYQERNILARKIGKEFDSAKILNSVWEWGDGLRAEAIERNILENGFKSSAYIAPALVTFVEDLKSSRRDESEPLSLHRKESSKSSNRSSITKLRMPQVLHYGNQLIDRINEIFRSRGQHRHHVQLQIHHSQTKLPQSIPVH